MSHEYSSLENTTIPFYSRIPLHFLIILLLLPFLLMSPSQPTNPLQRQRFLVYKKDWVLSRCFQCIVMFFWSSMKICSSGCFFYGNFCAIWNHQMETSYLNARKFVKPLPRVDVLRPWPGFEPMRFGTRCFTRPLGPLRNFCESTKAVHASWL